jgi:hypothetical protein
MAQPRERPPHPSTGVTQLSRSDRSTRYGSANLEKGKGPSLVLAPLAGKSCPHASNPHWEAPCPICEEHTLYIDYKLGRDGSPKLLMYCRGCTPAGDLLQRVCEVLGIEAWRVQEPDAYLTNLIGLPWAGADAAPARLPSEEKIDGWCRKLSRSSTAMDFLAKRGISPRTARLYRLGYDSSAITIPVYDADGVVHVRKGYRRDSLYEAWTTYAHE